MQMWPQLVVQHLLSPMQSLSVSHSSRQGPQRAPQPPALAPTSLTCGFPGGEPRSRQPLPLPRPFPGGAGTPGSALSSGQPRSGAGSGVCVRSAADAKGRYLSVVFHGTSWETWGGESLANCVRGLGFFEKCGCQLVRVAQHLSLSLLTLAVVFLLGITYLSQHPFSSELLWQRGQSSG